MKPKRTNRSRDYYRHHRKRVINRKRKIIKHFCWNVKKNEYGRLAKGKIHCSCWWCSKKTQRLGFPKSEKTRIEGLEEQLLDQDFGF
ncbi:hypothetical protein [Gordoniibacillus kamchatkensis]|uniref:hypothetical protein n=1 Tax=Gordoniibacillus kamchatkensis TaxID=1590651 RepID=UPI0012E04835|nr:hypothetical protein [Paenibacillus sp. VKM B-2647]